MTTGYSPYYLLLYGKEMKMPIDQFVKYWKGKAVQCEVDVEEYIQTLRANVEIVSDMARENEEEQKGSKRNITTERLRKENLELAILF